MRVIEVSTLDLASLESVRTFAAGVRERHARVHGLVNNAGVMNTPQGRTKDGFETQFGTNHLGHFHLTQLLLPLLLKTPQSRVVTVASRAHLAALNGITWESLEQVTRSRFGITEYAVSKLANILFASELARRHDVRSDNSVFQDYVGLPGFGLGKPVPASAAARAQAAAEQPVAPAPPQVSQPRMCALVR